MPSKKTVGPFNPRNPLQGKRFGRLVAVDIYDRQNGHLRYRCQCDCGKETLVKGIALNRGAVKSCGCYNRDKTIAYNTTHGLSRVNGKWTPEYGIWRGMKERCHNPKNTKYSSYGGRGIAVHPLWRNDYPAFLSYVGPRPSSAHSIDRINNEKGYEPGNVRWATLREQHINKRNTRRYFDINDEPILPSEIARYLAMTMGMFQWHFAKVINA